MNERDLFGSLLDELGEIRSSKEADALYTEAWNFVLSTLSQEAFREIFFEVEKLREARERGEIYHISEVCRKFFTEVSFWHAALKRNETPVPIQWPGDPPNEDPDNWDDDE